MENRDWTKISKTEISKIITCRYHKRWKLFGPELSYENPLWGFLRGTPFGDYWEFGFNYWNLDLSKWERDKETRRESISQRERERERERNIVGKRGRERER